MTFNARRLLPVTALIVLVAVLSACGAPPPDPAETADAFWTALARRDAGRVLEISDANSRRELNLGALPPVVAHDIGRIVIDGEQAEVTTRLSVSEPPVTAELITYLSRSEGRWQVDFDRTTRQLETRAEIEEIVGQVREIGEALSEELKRGVDTLRESLPGIREEFRRELDEMESEIARQLPELKRRLEAFSRQLEQALEPPPAPESDENEPPPPAGDGAPPDAPPAGEEGRIAT